MRSLISRGIEERETRVMGASGLSRPSVWSLEVRVWVSNGAGRRKRGELAGSRRARVRSWDVATRVRVTSERGEVAWVATWVGGGEPCVALRPSATMFERRDPKEHRS